MLELPTFKGRTGWEFTDLGDFTLDAWQPAPPPAEGGWMVEAPQRLLEPPAGAIELVQLDGATGEGVETDASPGAGAEPIVLPLSVARERHPELVEPHLGTIVAADDA